MRDLGPLFADIWRLAKPYFLSEERWSARGLLAAMVTLRLVLVGFNVMLSYWNNYFFNSLQDKDSATFIDLLLTWKVLPSGWIMPGFVGIAATYIGIGVCRVYLTQLLQIRWRRWMTGRFLQDWLSDRAYYRISLRAVDGVTTDNPDQRIAEDIRAFIGDAAGGNVRGILFFAIDLLSNVVTLFSFLTILWTLSGSLTLFGFSIPGYMVWVALIYAVAGTIVTHLIGRPLALLSFTKQKVEADFRFGLVRLRENMEGVALSAGEQHEIASLRVRFDALAANWLALMRRTKLLNALTLGYGQVAGIFPIVVAAPRFFSGHIPLGALTQTASAFGEVQGAMSWLVDNYAELAAFRATVERLATFHRAIEMAHAVATPGVTAVSEPGQEYALRDATIALPSGETLLSHSNLAFAPGRSVVVTGRSGSGKSTLFRALAGIWPFGSGHIQRAIGTSMFLPQRPYVPLGTLRQALAYPAESERCAPADLRAALGDCGLAHLADRLDEEDAWSQRLSGGEMQRLAIARALLARPDWLFLDEATANLDQEGEAAIYSMLRLRLPNTTIVSIAHRPAVAAQHDRVLRFERPPGRIIELASGEPRE